MTTVGGGRVFASFSAIEMVSIVLPLQIRSDVVKEHRQAKQLH